MPADPLEALLQRAGQEIGVSVWQDVDQTRIDAFAATTGDHAWAHVDPLRAAAGPFGGTVAHGLLTLSLLPAMLYEIVPDMGPWMGVNYGFDRVRFVAPVPQGARLRGRFTLLRAEREGEDRLAMDWNVTVEIEGGARPAAVAVWLNRFLRV
ncbi:MAG: MaoC family dehydratase [Rhodosalinus sp.]